LPSLTRLSRTSLRSGSQFPYGLESATIRFELAANLLDVDVNGPQFDGDAKSFFD
jgi:hypothetical protein